MSVVHISSTQTGNATLLLPRYLPRETCASRMSAIASQWATYRLATRQSASGLNELTGELNSERRGLRSFTGGIRAARSNWPLIVPRVSSNVQLIRHLRGADSCSVKRRQFERAVLMCVERRRRAATLRFANAMRCDASDRSVSRGAIRIRLLESHPQGLYSIGSNCVSLFIIGEQIAQMFEKCKAICLHTAVHCTVLSDRSAFLILFTCCVH